MDHFCKQPKYFSKFKCIGGECPRSCCDGWVVNWSDEELSKLKSANCSDGLKELIDNCFTRDKDDKDNLIKMCDDGRCPFHNHETDLCDIQKEVGAKYLGIICKRYPRQYIERDNLLFRWCVGSCPAVLDFLIDDENAVTIENILCRDYKKLDLSKIKVDNMEAMKLAPIKVYRFILLDFFMDLLTQKDRSFDNSMILAALGVKHLSDAEIKGNYMDIPKIIKDLTPQLNNPQTVRSLDDIKPNYQLKFKLINNMTVKFFEEKPGIINIISSIHDGNELIMERYTEGTEKFMNAFSNHNWVLKNILINLFLDLEVPIGKIECSLFENYSFFVLACATIKAFAAAIGYISKDIREDFKICVAELNRSFAHNPIKAGHMINEMKELGLTTPAHLALIIKG